MCLAFTICLIFYFRKALICSGSQIIRFVLVCFFCGRKRLELMFFCKCVKLWNEIDSNLISWFFPNFFGYTSVLTPSKACFKVSRILKFEIFLGSTLAPAGADLQHPQTPSYIHACYVWNTSARDETYCGMSAYKNI